MCSLRSKQMNQTEQILLQAIQKSLWNTGITFPDDTDWDAVLREASVQTVLGTVIDVAPAEFRQKWKGIASAGMAHFVRILHYQEQMYHLLKENGIPMVILKGTAAAICYPNPSQRVMGDIDFLVPIEYFDRAKDVFIQNGYTIEEDEKYQRHIDVIKDQMSFEMHRFFSDTSYDIERFIRDGVQNAETRQIFGSTFPMLPKLANGLVLLGHMAGHLRTGLGLRQVIDWIMYVDKELDDVFWNKEFQAAARESGLETIAITATKVCQQYLGLKDSITWCKDADEETCRMLMDSLLSSGNFGRKRGKGTDIEKVVTSFKKKGALRYLQTAGEHNWKAYEKHRWLKPFCWIYQTGRYIKQGIQAKRSGNQIAADFERGNQRSELLKRLGL